MEPGKWECLFRGDNVKTERASCDVKPGRKTEEPHHAPGSVTEWGEVMAVEEIDQVCYSWAPTNREGQVD